MISQVMQQLIGPVLQGATGDSDSQLGGDQGDEFAGLMAEGDDSLIMAEGATKGATDNLLAPIAMPEPAATIPAAPIPAVIAVQFNLPAAAEVAANFQSYEMLRPIYVQNTVGENPIPANPNAGMIVPNARIPLAADSKLDLAASTALGKVEGGNGRGLFGQSAVVIAPSLEGGSSVHGLPDLADGAGRLMPPDAPVRAQTSATVLDAIQTPITEAAKVAPDNPASVSANSSTTLDRPSGSIPQPGISITSSAAPNIVPQNVHPLATQSLVAGLGAKAGAPDLPLREQLARTADGPAPLVTLRRFSSTANAALAALQGISQIADSQTKIDGTIAANSARMGEHLFSQTPNAQMTIVVPATGAGPAVGQTPAQITAALFASVAGDTSDFLGTAFEESAGNSLLGIDARHGFASSFGASAAGTVSTGFAGAPTTAAQLSAQLLPLAQSAQSGPVELVLSPAELGQLRFEIHHRGDQVQIILSAERPETLDLLRRNSEQLLADFRNAGFAGASLAFGGWGAGQNAGANPQEFDREGQPDGGSGAAQIPSSPPSQNAAFARAQSYLDPSRSLNLRL